MQRTNATLAEERLRKRDFVQFRQLLEAERARIVANAHRMLTGEIHLDPDDFFDEIDTASSQTDLAFIGRMRDRERGLLGKIDAALARIAEGTFGECEDCGEPIGRGRLQARPVAERCIDCKGRQERLERQLA